MHIHVCIYVYRKSYTYTEPHIQSIRVCLISIVHVWKHLLHLHLHLTPIHSKTQYRIIPLISPYTLMPEREKAALWPENHTNAAILSWRFAGSIIAGKSYE